MYNSLDKIENTVLVEILAYMYSPNHHFFTRTPSEIKDFIKQVNMKKYKIKHQDLDTIKESLIYLNSKSVEKIFVQSYLLSLEWNKLKNLDTSIFYDVFSVLGEIKINLLIQKANKYNDGIIIFEELFPEDDTKKIGYAVKEKAFKIFEKLKNEDINKIDENILYKLNKGSLKKVWDKVVKNIEIIRNPSVPSHIKAIAIGALLYVIIPIDAVPDFIPFGGLVDDAAVIALAIEQIGSLLKSRSSS